MTDALNKRVIVSNESSENGNDKSVLSIVHEVDEFCKEISQFKVLSLLFNKQSYICIYIYIYSFNFYRKEYMSLKLLNLNYTQKRLIVRVF